MAVTTTLAPFPNPAPNIQTQSQEVFSQNADSAFSHLITEFPDINAVGDEINSTAIEVNDNAVIASQKATIATDQATISTDEATASAASAASALSSLNEFKGQYYGSLASEPTTDPLGNAMGKGDLYYNSTTNEINSFDGVAWSVPKLGATAGFRNEEFTATAGQTVFTVAGGYSPAAATVFKNGAKLIAGVDVDLTSGTTFTLTVGAVATDVFDFLGFGSFDVADTYSMAQIDTKDDERVNKANLITALQKTDSSKAAFEVSAATLITSQKIVVSVAGTQVAFAAGVLVTLPALTSAGDYKIYATVSGLAAQPWDSAAPAGSVGLGGFHVFHTTGTINPDSIWDARWRPSCSPRGMTLSPGQGVWVDIYLMDIDYGINGYSKGGATIADGLSPPKIPAIYGGNGTATYGSLTWFEAWDLAMAAGKRLPLYGEFTGFAYGVVEAQSVGADPVTTKNNPGYRSACGCEQATGVMWQWGADINGTSAVGTPSYQEITDGRGSVYAGDIKAVILGGYWGDAAIAGSRASRWDNAPSLSGNGVGARALCDHLVL